VKLAKALPEFSAELQSCLSTLGREDIAVQVQEVEIERYTYDDSAKAAYIYVQSPRLLNVAEVNIIGIKHGETISVEHRYWVNVDTDNFGRLRGIELLNCSEVVAALSKNSSNLGS
jgi:uncharacterized protein YuzE